MGTRLSGRVHYPADSAPREGKEEREIMNDVEDEVSYYLNVSFIIIYIIISRGYGMKTRRRLEKLRHLMTRSAKHRLRHILLHSLTEYLVNN